MEEYVTIAKEAHIEFTEKRSVFLGHVFPVSTEEAALAFLGGVKGRYADATHNVYAYVLRENNVSRYSDAGEPQGTAGMPALDAIRKKKAVDALVVITRYFGGIQLGGGGLVRAYSRAASEAIASSGLVLMRPCLLFSLRCRYNEYERIKNLLSSLGGAERSSSFSSDVSLVCSIESRRFDAFRVGLGEITNGRAVPKETGEVYGSFPLPSGD